MISLFERAKAGSTKTPKKTVFKCASLPASACSQRGAAAGKGEEENRAGGVEWHKANEVHFLKKGG